MCLYNSNMINLLYCGKLYSRINQAKDISANDIIKSSVDLFFIMLIFKTITGCIILCKEYKIPLL